MLNNGFYFQDNFIFASLHIFPSLKERIATNYMVKGITAMALGLDIWAPKKFKIFKAVGLKLGSRNPGVSERAET